MRLTLVELAVLVLRHAATRAGGGRVDDESVRLALRCLLPHVSDRHLLIELWSYAGQPPNANRSESCFAVLGSIVADLQASGRYPSDDQAHRRLIADRLHANGDGRAVSNAIKRRHYFAPPPRRR